MRRPKLALLLSLLVCIPLLAQSTPTQSPPGQPPPAPASQAQSPPLQVPYRQFRLANGLTVLLHQDRSVPIVAVNVWYHVGSANEKPGRTGFAHLFEHLMF